MNQVKIALVEDALAYAFVIKHKLEKLNYIVPQPCDNYEDAITMLDNEKPDLVILDIHLRGDRDGVDVAEYIRLNLDIPFIFHTSHSDKAMMERVKKVKPNALLTKPLREKDLLISIELALSNFSARNSSENTIAKANGNGDSYHENGDNFLIKDSFFIRDGKYFQKIKFNDVLYMESDGPYLTIYTEEKKYFVRGSISQYLEKMHSVNFFKVHRSYVVNLDKIEKINTVTLTINGQIIPISKNYRDDLLRQMNVV